MNIRMHDCTFSQFKSVVLGGTNNPRTRLYIALVDIENDLQNITYNSNEFQQYA